VFVAQHKQTGLDLEAIEMATRSSLHQVGTGVLTMLLATAASPAAKQPCDCGHSADYHGQRPKQLFTVLGPVTFQRAYYLCRHCHQGQSPRDKQLDVVGTQWSPGVRRMMAMVGSECSFEQSREQLALLAGLDVAAKAVERQAEAIGVDMERRDQEQIHRAKQLDLPEVCSPAVPVLYIEMDGTGVPMIKQEVADRSGKHGGQAHTREAKLGCVFTQTTADDKGRPVRDEQSTTYVGAIETAEQFGLRIYTEAWKRGWSRAQTKVILGDGAVWIWNLADEHFPSAIQIVDLYHAREHIHDLAKALWANDERTRKRWSARMLRLLDQGKIESLVKAFGQIRPATPEIAKTLATETEYFERNKKRMRYPAFRARHLFVGSGVIEAGCKTVVAARLKRSGMFWTVAGANAIIALRCTRLSGGFEDYWENRCAA